MKSLIPQTFKPLVIESLPGRFKQFSREQLDLYLSYRAYGYGHKMTIAKLKEAFESLPTVSLESSLFLERRDDYAVVVRDIQAKHLEERIQSSLGDRQKRIVAASNIAFYLGEMIEDEIVDAKEKKKKPSIQNVVRLAGEWRKFSDYIKSESQGLNIEDLQKLSDFHQHRERLKAKLDPEFQTRIGLADEEKEVIEVGSEVAS